MDSLFLDKLTKVVFDDSETIRTGADLIDVIKGSAVHLNNPFHKETLFEHLIQAGVHAHTYAIRKGWIGSDDDWLYFVAGFLHDVGKPGSRRPLFKSKNKTSLKGHAVCGAAMMDSWLLNESFLTEFGLSTREAGMIATVANFHMCVYSPVKYHMNLLKTAVGDIDTAKLLCAVRHGDKMAKVPPQYNDDVFDEEFMLTGTYKGGVFPPNNLGLLINVTGFSGCGKSTIARQTVQFLQEKYGLELGKDVFWISRDDVTRSVVDRESPHLTEREAFIYYQRNKDKLSPRVNAEINARVTEVLSAGERVCILDTMALMSCTARKAILKNVPRDTVSIDLWAHRRESTYTEEEANTRLGGMTKAQQLAINAENITDDMDVIGSDVMWAARDSVMENRCPTESLAKSMYVLPIGHGKYLMRDRYMALLGRLMDERLQSGRLHTLPPVLSDDTRDMSLHEIVSGLVASDESLERFRRFFKSHAYTTSTKEFGLQKYLVSIKYIDKQNKIMSHKWAREARGMGFVIDVSVAGAPIVKTIKRPLERCVEVLSFDHHVRSGIRESQDMKVFGDLSFLNKEQRDVVEIFNHHADELLDDQEDWYITSKVDGCLLVVSIFDRKIDGQVYKYMAEAVQKCGMWHVFDGDRLYVPSTSGSVEIGPNMKTTLITAAAGALGALGLERADDPDWVWYQAGLGQDLMRAISDCYPFNPQTMIMEMVCADRTTYDGLTQHREIAVSYPHSALYVLGCYDSTGVYTPVYRMDTVQNSTFREPRTLKITTPSNALYYMGLTEDATLSHQHPSPLAYDFHPEGFILTRHDKNDSLLASCKLKTSVYYKAHSLDGILNKMFDSKTKMLMTAADVIERGALNENDVATIEYMRKASTADDTSNGGTSPIGVVYRPRRFVNTFPEVTRFLYVVDGRIQKEVRAFCDEAMTSIVEAIALGNIAAVDYSKLPASLVDRRSKIDIANGGEDYEHVCQYIVSAPFDDCWFKGAISELFRVKFGVKTHTDEQVFIMAKKILKVNKSWKKNETRAIEIPKDFVEMVVSGI